jgi:hypothetical protein
MCSSGFEGATNQLYVCCVVYAVTQGHKHGDALSAETGALERLTGILPVGRELSVGLKLEGEDEALAVLYVTGVHTLDADNFSTQPVGYFFRNSLTTVVHDDD